MLLKPMNRKFIHIFWGIVWLIVTGFIFYKIVNGKDIWFIASPFSLILAIKSFYYALIDPGY